MEQTNKLYKIYTTGISFPFFVVAKGLDEAYNKVRNFLDTNNYDFSSNRNLKSIEVIAEEKPFRKTENLLLT